MYYNKNFSALLKEAQFTKEILAIGVTQLYKANYAKKEFITSHLHVYPLV